jgi:hypothetical protein
MPIASSFIGQEESFEDFELSRDKTRAEMMAFGSEGAMI